MICNKRLSRNWHPDYVHDLVLIKSVHLLITTTINSQKPMIKQIGIILFCLLPYSMTAQSLSGIWEGEYTHYFPSCCDETRYTCRFSIYEDGRGVLWMESLLSPAGDPDVTGRFFVAGFKTGEKIYFADIKETFNGTFYTASCFHDCGEWCRKEYSLRYEHQEGKEILYGVWNSRLCHPGGDVQMTKVSGLPAGDHIRLIEEGRRNDFDPIRMKNLYPPLSLGMIKEDSTILGVRVGGMAIFGEHFRLKVKNPRDLVNREKDMILQNVTSRVNEDSYLRIIYFELKDQKTGKVYTFNPLNIPRKEVLDLDVSVYGLTFPNRSEWEDMIERAPVMPKGILLSPVEPSKEPLPSFMDRKVVAGDAISLPAREVELQIWDHAKLDGDIVSVFVNGTCVLNKYTLARNKKTIKVNLNKGENLITLYAENLGTIPPNTSAISVTCNGRLIKALILRSDMEKSEAIRLVAE